MSLMLFMIMCPYWIEILLFFNNNIFFNKIKHDINKKHYVHIYTQI